MERRAARAVLLTRWESMNSSIPPSEANRRAPGPAALASLAAVLHKSRKSAVVPRVILDRAAREFGSQIEDSATYDCDDV